ncbi:ABC transporter ATP-binding protein [Egibacter rhizosphaerae]|uniref:ABC-type quaternary amine transporter n=1 Tax=Egibacter rhizosphaerae TaxID=1670831 RepID=A0A411YE45_9ACTN|nr:ABC transporter ATP-binding protein [Egibacter rhizosphaerae]QBI19485.1 ABC transporter ATP-binding protein [Egibacter rhizosphaerae]
MADLELDDVWMSYPGSPSVLRGLTLRVADGEFYAMVGPSGSGKTSILKVLAGFVEPDQGSVVLDGRTINGVPPEDRDLGIVFQSYALFPHMTVADNIGFGLRMRGVRGKRRSGRTAELLDLVGLPGLEHRYPDELSGGQQQRVALARALITEPKALLLDEPLSALDRKIRQDMQAELRRIQRETRVTAIIVTHDQEEALALGDRLMVLEGGGVQQEGSPEDVYRRPRNRFVATFLGAANLFPGRVESSEPSVVSLGEGLVVRGLDLPDHAGTGDLVEVCVRPEHWEVLEAAEVPSQPTDGLLLDARIETVQLAGQVVDCRTSTILGSVAVTVLSPQARTTREGTSVRLRAAPREVHVFDHGSAREAVGGDATTPTVT